jgi:hypothetical protein
MVKLRDDGDISGSIAIRRGSQPASMKLITWRLRGTGVHYRPLISRLIAVTDGEISDINVATKKCPMLRCEMRNQISKYPGGECERQ